MSKVTKEYLYTATVGSYYQWKVYRITDARQQIYYVAERTNHGRTEIVDDIKDILPKLEWQARILDDFLSKVR